MLFEHEKFSVEMLLYSYAIVMPNSGCLTVRATGATECQCRRVFSFDVQVPSYALTPPVHNTKLARPGFLCVLRPMTDIVKVLEPCSSDISGTLGRPRKAYFEQMYLALFVVFSCFYLESLSPEFLFPIHCNCLKSLKRTA